MTTRFSRNKKASALDIMFIGVMAFAFGLMMLIGYKFVNTFNSNIQGMSAIPQSAKTGVNQIEATYTGTMDNIFLFFVVGGSIIAFILASLVRVHPVFIPFYLIYMIIFIIISAALSNAWQEAASNPQFSALSPNLVFTNHILTYLPFVVAIMSTILMIVMYKTWSAGR